MQLQQRRKIKRISIAPASSHVSSHSPSPAGTSQSAAFSTIAGTEHAHTHRHALHAMRRGGRDGRRRSGPGGVFKVDSIGILKRNLEKIVSPSLARVLRNSLSLM